MKSTQQALFEDLLCVAGIENVVNVSTAEFSVDDLLDLSDKGFNNDCFEEYSEEDEEKDFLSVSSQDNQKNSTISSNFPSVGDLVSLPAGEIQLPVDDLESLEWLSHIVDDSTSDLSLLFPAATLKENTGKFALNRHEPAVRPVIPSFTVLGLSYPVPRKYRTKRSKKTGRGWSSLTESSIGTSSSYDSTITSPMHFPDPIQLIETLFSFQKPPTKKHKKNPGSGSSSSDSSGSVTQRGCTHCQVQKTPQWRTGPLGPKTLCNACGVRFKSGRLFPEYRPACSPSFSDDIHSNSHRRVLEMRKKKETEVVEPEFNSGFRSFSN